MVRDMHVVARFRFVLMAKCRASLTSPHRFKGNCSSNLIFVVFFFQSSLFLAPIDASSQFLLHTWMPIVVPFEHFVLELLFHFLPSFV
jgi:hypothetical protein